MTTKAELIERHARLLDVMKLIERGNKPYRDGEQWAVTAKLELGRMIAETLMTACKMRDDVAGPAVAPTREEVRDAANIATGGRLAPAALEALAAKVAAQYIAEGAVIVEEADAIRLAS